MARSQSQQVSPVHAVVRLHDVADEYVAVETHWRFGSIRAFYCVFSLTSEDEVIECLRSVAEQRSSTVSDGSKPASMRSEDVIFDVGGAGLEGRLCVPEEAVGLVVFAHGTGSSRHSSRNRSVESVLNDGGVATLLMDLLSVEEEASQGNVLDVALLGDRLTATQDWLQQQPSVAHLPVGLFGVSTGAAAALWSAAEPTSNVAAIVARGGRPELAGLRLASVRAPTLLIVGSHDARVLTLNREMLGQLRCEAKLLTVPRTTHLFEEPGALAVVAELASDWFLDHFSLDPPCR